MGVNGRYDYSESSSVADSRMRRLGSCRTFLRWEAGLCRRMNCSLLRYFMNRSSKYVFVSHERSFAKLILDFSSTSSIYSL